MGSKVLASVIPVLLGLIGAIVANIPVPLFGGWMPPPLLALMPIYFWCLVRPDLMSPAWAFAIGVLQDLMSGGLTSSGQMTIDQMPGSSVGIWAISVVAMYILIDRQRDVFAGLSGWGALLGFATATLVACAVAYIVSVVIVNDLRLLPLAPFAVQFAVTVLFYVPGAFILGFVHRRFVGPLRSDF